MSFRAALPVVTNPLALRGAITGGRRAGTERRAGGAGRPRGVYPLLLAIFAACCMLWAQQGATAHYIEHLGSATAAASTAAADHDGDDPLQVCATCAVFAGLAGAPPAFVSPLALVPAKAAPAADSPSAYLPARPAPPYAARAPPATL